MKTLIIAEKPSVATDLAKTLAKAPGVGKLERKKDYFENETTYISSAIGHLVELAMPTDPNGKKIGWSFKHLPILPEQFDLQPIERSQARFKLLLKLMRKKDVDCIINACDAGREGELIFRYLIEAAKINKPIKRLWMQSMTSQAILEAWGELRGDKEMHPLADAAMCRSESDWLIGINATRALTAYRSRNGGFNLTTAGRVQTPTLSILAKREFEIQAFKSTPYAEIHAQFDVTAGTYASKWIDPQFKKDPTNPHARSERIWDLEKAKSILARCEGKTGSVTEEKKPTKQIAPQLYDLTTLQREAPFTAKNTLGLAQALYEKHKMLTYPRTDSRYLPEDYLSKVVEATEAIAGSNLGIAKWAKDSIKNNRVTFQKRIFNNSKVSDHFAIIPTGRVVSLNEQESKLYDMVVKRFIATFFPHAEFEVTKRLTTINDTNDVFETNGKILTNPGWLAVYGRTVGVASGQDELCAVNKAENANNSAIELLEKETNPPARYTESTLLSAMEGAGKLVEDDDLREAMSERGLGTPATRAAIIEGLIREKYLLRDARNLVVSPKGLELITLLQKVGIDILSSPEMTGEWEYKLKQMELGKLDRPSFMQEIRKISKDMVAKTYEFNEKVINKKFPDLSVKCPKCNRQNLKTTDAHYACHDPECDFRLRRHVASYELTTGEATQLLETKKTDLIDKFKSRFGKPFAAQLELTEELKVNFIFEGQEEAEKEVQSLSDSQVLTTTKIDDNKEVKVYETERAYLCPEMASDKVKNGTRIPKTLLQREIPADQAIKLFQDRKTDLLQGFISKKGRPFAAHLTLDAATGKLGWEFAPPKKKAAKKASKKSAA